MFFCPICGGALKREENALRCERRHSFDLAAQGYANLLPPNKKSSKDPGDNAEMVSGRTRFLDGGSYRPLSDALGETILSLCPGRSPRILDAGCGEGYYAGRLFEALVAARKRPALCGVDISKRAVRHAAGRCKQARFAVASLFELPLARGSMDLCYNVFSPVCAPEFVRVLREDGHFVAVYPAARHLFALKEVLYDAPYENAPKDFLLEGLELVEKRRLSYRFTLNSNLLIKSLFMMTPYYYKTPVSGSKRLEDCRVLTCEADFWIVTYRKGGRT